MSLAIDPANALKDAVRQAGSQAGFARLIGVRQPAVSKWLRDGKHLPAEHVLTVERETGISRHDLRPDLYPRDSAAPAPAPSRAAADRAAMAPAR